MYLNYESVFSLEIPKKTFVKDNILWWHGYVCVCINNRIQDVPEGMDKTSGECSSC